MKVGSNSSLSVGLLEQRELQRTQPRVRAHVDAHVLELGAQPGFVVELLQAETGVVAADCLDHREAGERFCQIERLPLVGKRQGAERLLGGMAQQALGEVHEQRVVRIRLVELHHGEFGVVARAEPFVAEAAVDFEHLLEAAHHQALEIKLGRNAQEQFHVQGVVMRLERLARRHRRGWGASSAFPPPGSRARSCNGGWPG